MVELSLPVLRLRFVVAGIRTTNLHLQGPRSNRLRWCKHKKFLIFWFGLTCLTDIAIPTCNCNTNLQLLSKRNVFKASFQNVILRLNWHYRRDQIWNKPVKAVTFITLMVGFVVLGWYQGFAPFHGNFSSCWVYI